MIIVKFKKSVIALIFPQYEVGMFATMGFSSLYQIVLSGIYTIFYTVVLILPFTKYRKRVPERKTFYVYVAFLAFINLLQIIGAVLSVACIPVGIWYVNNDYSLNFHSLDSITKVFYLSFYAPIMYWCFLREFFQEVTSECKTEN